MAQSEKNESGASRKRLLRIAEVTALVGLSRATVYRLIDSGGFPRPVRLSPGRVAWVRREVEDWMSRLEEAPRA